MKKSVSLVSFLLGAFWGLAVYADAQPAVAPAPISEASAPVSAAQARIDAAPAAAKSVAAAPVAATATLDFTPDKDRSVIFIYRNDSFLYAASNISVFVSGDRIGDMQGSTYIRLSAPPGEHKLLVTGRGGNSSFELLTERNRVYYLWLDAQSTLPLGPRPQLSLVDNARGKSDLLQCAQCRLADNAMSSINDQPAAEVKTEGQKTAEQQAAEQPIAGDGKSIVKNAELPKEDIRAKFQSLKSLLDDGIITREEYETKRKQLLDAL